MKKELVDPDRINTGLMLASWEGVKITNQYWLETFQSLQVKSREHFAGKELAELDKLNQVTLGSLAKEAEKNLKKASKIIDGLKAQMGGFDDDEEDYDGSSFFS